MRGLVGPLIAAIGVIHILSVAALRRRDILALGRRGVGGLRSASPQQASTFWSLLFGTMAATVGYLVTVSQRRSDVIPALPGWVMVGVGSLGVLLSPRSPFILVGVLGLAVVRQARHNPR